MKFDSTKDEEPILFYTEQFNFLKSQDRKIIFRALLTMRMMEIKGWDYWVWYEVFMRWKLKWTLNKNFDDSLFIIESSS